MRTRLAPRGYCPLHELRFAIVTGDGRYLASKEVPYQWDADIDKALLWNSMIEANAFLASSFSRSRRSVIQIREEARRA